MKKSWSDKITVWVFYIFTSAFAIACLYPFLLLIVASFTDEISLLNKGYTLIPEKLSLSAYKLIFSNDVIYKAYFVTIFTTVVGTGLSMLCTFGLAYAMMGNNIKYKNQIAFYLFFTMLFSGGLVPTYILIVKYLQLKDSIWVYILPALVNPFNVFLMRNFFNTIPTSLQEAAIIDGANDVVILCKIILPISMPAIATVSLFYALSYWNEWFKAVLYIEDANLYSLQYIIMKIIRNIDFAGQMSRNSNINMQGMIPSYSTRMAITVATIGPIILLYPFLQKYFVKGVTIGAVKG